MVEGGNHGIWLRGVGVNAEVVGRCRQDGVSIGIIQPWAVGGLREVTVPPAVGQNSACNRGCLMVHAAAVEGRKDEEEVVAVAVAWVEEFDATHRVGNAKSLDGTLDE